MSWYKKILIFIGCLFVILAIFAFLVIRGFSNFSFDTTQQNPPELGPNDFLYPSSSAEHAAYEKIKDKALEKSDPSICIDLPISGLYYKDGGFLESGYMHNPQRLGCLMEYMRKNQTIDVCNLIEEKVAKLSHTSYNAGDNCFSALAERKKDKNICDYIKNNDSKIRCNAYIQNDTELCYKLTKDEHDISEYSRATGWCIGETVLKNNGDIELCKIINNEKYGEQWKIMRNECIMGVAFWAKRAGKPLKPICDIMVEDERGWNNKEQCYKGEINDYRAVLRLPPYDKE